MKKFEYTELVYGAYGVKCPQDKADYKPTSTIITGYLLNEMAGRCVGVIVMIHGIDIISKGKLRSKIGKSYSHGEKVVGKDMQ